MDEFDFKEEKTKKSFKIGSAFWNCASMFLFIAALAVAGFFALLFLDPQSGLNPFPPLVATATEAATATSTPEVATATATLEPTATATLEPTAEPLSRSYAIQEGSPAPLDASVFHPELGCNFLGIAGQAFGADGAPLADLQVRVTGTLNNEAVDKVGVTGAATQFGAGSYYEVQLANAPVISENALQVTLQTTDGQALSAPFTFSTTDSCQANLILINFVEE